MCCFTRLRHLIGLIKRWAANSLAEKGYTWLVGIENKQEGESRLGRGENEGQREEDTHLEVKWWCTQSYRAGRPWREALIPGSLALALGPDTSRRSQSALDTSLVPETHSVLQLLGACRRPWMVPLRPAFVVLWSPLTKLKIPALSALHPCQFRTSYLQLDFSFSFSFFLFLALDKWKKYHS